VFFLFGRAKHSFKIDSGHASYITRPDDVVEAIIDGAKM